MLGKRATRGVDVAPRVPVQHELGTAHGIAVEQVGEAPGATEPGGSFRELSLAGRGDRRSRLETSTSRTAHTSESTCQGSCSPARPASSTAWRRLAGEPEDDIRRDPVARSRHRTSPGNGLAPRRASVALRPWAPPPIRASSGPQAALPAPRRAQTPAASPGWHLIGEARAEHYLEAVTVTEDSRGYLGDVATLLWHLARDQVHRLETAPRSGDFCPRRRVRRHDGSGSVHRNDPRGPRAQASGGLRHCGRHGYLLRGARPVLHPTDAAAVDHAELADAVAELNALEGRRGYFTEVFCERARYLRPENGARVDAIRDAIEERHRDSPLYPSAAHEPARGRRPGRLDDRAADGVLKDSGPRDRCNLSR